MACCARVVQVRRAEELPRAAVDGLPTLVYWDICDRAQPIRYALELAGTRYVDVRVEAGDPGPAFRRAWLDGRDGLAAVLAFPNLPYCLWPDGAALSQSAAILRRVARGAAEDLEAGADRDAANLALDQATDFDEGLTSGATHDLADLLDTYFRGDELKGVLAKWSAFLADKPFLTGDAVSIADCKFYECLRKIHVIATECRVNHDAPFFAFHNLDAYLLRFQALPAIARYQASAAFRPRPLNNTNAQFR